MKETVDYNALEYPYGCDNCKHESDGFWDEYCGICNPDYIPPSKYRPAKGSEAERVYYRYR